MPRPTPADRHVDAILSNVGMAYFQDPGIYVATRVFPVAPVTKQSGYFRKYSVADLLRLEAQKMSPGTAAPQDTTNFANTQYMTEKYGLGDFLTPEDVANDDGPIDPEEMTIAGLMQAHMTKMERAWASAYFGTSIWGKDWTGVAATPTTNQFLQFDASSGDPVDVLIRAGRYVQQTTGFRPNVAVIGAPVMDHLKINASIKDRLKYTGQPGAKVTPQMLASLFEVDEVVEASAIYNAAKEGQTASMTAIYSDDVLLAYRANAPSPRVPSAGYTFVWNTPSDAPQGTQVVVRKIPRPEMGNRTDYEAIIYWQMMATATDLGIFLTDCLA